MVEGSEEFGLTLNLNHQIDFSYIVRQELETQEREVCAEGKTLGDIHIEMVIKIGKWHKSS